MFKGERQVSTHMLTILGFAMIATFLVLIMLKKMPPIAALVLGAGILFGII
ncbi:hypothetical protein ACWDZ8_08790 [Streptomyces sp. NPDC003233]